MGCGGIVEIPPFLIEGPGFEPLEMKKDPVKSAAPRNEPCNIAQIIFS